MELIKYKSEIRKAYKKENTPLVKAIIGMSYVDTELDDTAREDVSDYAIQQAYKAVLLKRAARKAIVKESVQ